jgi:hypothetical protein
VYFKKRMKGKWWVRKASRPPGPTGVALALLNVIHRKGIDAIL